MTCVVLSDPAESPAQVQQWPRHGVTEVAHSGSWSCSTVLRLAGLHAIPLPLRGVLVQVQLLKDGLHRRVS